MRWLNFNSESDGDFWYENREHLQNVCIFPEFRIDGLPERACRIYRQRITRLPGHYYFHQYEEDHDQWGDSDSETIVQLPDSLPAGWGAGQMIVWMIEHSKHSIRPEDVEHLRSNRHLMHLLRQPLDADLFLEAPGIGGIFAFSGRDYNAKHPYTLNGTMLEVNIRIPAEVLCPEQAVSLQNLFGIFSADSCEMVQLTEEVFPHAVPSEVEVLDAGSAFIYLTGTQPGYARHCAMAHGWSDQWSFDPLD